jgi:hypothetical protein
MRIKFDDFAVHEVSIEYDLHRIAQVERLNRHFSPLSPLGEAGNGLLSPDRTASTYCQHIKTYNPPQPSQQIIQ